jgi:molybdate-binding protein/DNA-binding XRE family transcriptional regulator
MILTYNGTIMTKHPKSINRVRECRMAAGLTQAELADRAGISRTAVTAIEAHRAVPSVAAALALASALKTTVEALFGQHEPVDRRSAWAWDPPKKPSTFWAAEVGGQSWLYPAESAGMLTPLPDGMITKESSLPTVSSTAKQTLVMAGCDPAAGLLATEYSRATGMRMLVLLRSSRQALELLQQGKVHVAGLHLSTQDEPDGNAKLVRETLGSGYELLRIACWQEGIATAPDLKIRTVRGALRSNLRWVGREPGSGARQCLDRLMGDRAGPRHVARHHRGVAEAVQNGWADAGICVQLTSMEAGLGFLPVQEEPYDVCISRALLDDPRGQALLRVVRSKSYRTLLAQLPGYSTSETGSVEFVD